MSFELSLITTVISALLFALATWQGRREREPGRPALFPWHGLQFVALVGMVVFGVHLLSLWTGIDFKGRYQ